MNDAQLYKISDVVRSCGISRSTVLRMEDKGLLIPCRVSPESGRRYYDSFDVTKINQIEHFKEMGLNSEEILTYYSSREGELEVLERLEERLYHLQRSVEELRLHIKRTDEMVVQIMDIPGETYLMRRGEGIYSDDFGEVLEALYAHCLNEGIVFRPRPFFVELECEDYLDGIVTTHPYPFSVCMPVDPATAPPEARYIPPCKVLSVVLYGDYRRSSEAWLRLGEELKKRGLKPAGWPRVIALAAGYNGREVQDDNWCIRTMVPIVSEDEGTL